MFKTKKIVHTAIFNKYFCNCLSSVILSGEAGGFEVGDAQRGEDNVLDVGFFDIIKSVVVDGGDRHPFHQDRFCSAQKVFAGFRIALA